MKKLFICLVFFAVGCSTVTHKFGNNSNSQNTGASRYSGTIVNITAVNIIQSELIESAKNAYFTVSEDVKDKYGNTFLRKNQTVSAVITVNSRGSVGRPGKIVLEFQETKDIWGKPVYFDNDPLVFEGANRRGLVAGLTVGMFFVYAPFNFIHLVHEGFDVTIPAGYIFRAKIK